MCILSVSVSGLTGHMRTLSLGSGGWDGEGALVHLNPHHYAPSWTPQERGGGGDRRSQRLWYVTGCLSFDVTAGMSASLSHSSASDHHQVNILMRLIFGFLTKTDDIPISLSFTLHLLLIS